MAEVQPTQQEDSRRHLVFVISDSSRFMSELTAAIEPYFQSLSFDNSEALIETCEKRLPRVLIVDTPKAGSRMIDVISKVRLHFKADQLPIVLTVAPENTDFITASKKFAGLHVLDKPFTPIQLFNAISSRINANIEASWESIEPLQRAALKQTLSSFNHIADNIIDGTPIEYDSVADSCKPLLEAVHNQNYQELLKGLRDHDNFSYVHSMRVATFISLLGDIIGIKGEDHMTLTTGGLLHDVGKMLIPYDLINKSGKLDDEEFDRIKAHVPFTIDFLYHTRNLPKGVAIIAGQHHEKLDGSGYPHGLSGNKLNELARMATIVDIFTALTDRRTYKAALQPAEALSKMSEMSGHLDVKLLALFREMLLDTAKTA